MTSHQFRPEERSWMWLWFRTWLKSLKFVVEDGMAEEPKYYLHGLETLGPQLRELEFDALPKAVFDHSDVQLKVPTMFPNLELLNCTLPLNPTFSAGFNNLRVLKLRIWVVLTHECAVDVQHRESTFRILLEALRSGLFPKVEVLAVRMPVGSRDDGPNASAVWTELVFWCATNAVSLYHLNQ